MAFEALQKRLEQECTDPNELGGLMNPAKALTCLNLLQWEI